MHTHIVQACEHGVNQQKACEHGLNRDHIKMVPGQDHLRKSSSDNPRNFRKSQAWFPLILGISVEIPLQFQIHKKLLTDPLGNSHPMGLQGHLQLVAWTVSGVCSKIEEFQRVLSSSSMLHGEAIQSIIPYS